MSTDAPSAVFAAEAMPWTRWVENQIKALLRSNARAASDSAAANGTARGGINGLIRTVQKLSEQQEILASQQEDLLGRKSYSIYTPGSLSWSTPTLLTDYNFGPPIIFTLEEPRVVSISCYFAAGGSAVAATSGSTANYNVTGAIKIDGSTPSGQTMGSFAGSANYNGGPSNSSQSASPAARWLGVLAAGQHTVHASLWNASIGTTGSGSGYLYVQNPSLFVDIMQKAS